MDKIDTLKLTDAGLLEAFDFADRAADRARDGFRLRFPVDATIRWVRNDAVQFGQVVRHGAAVGDRLEVRNTDTGAVYWIHMSDVLAAMRGGH